MDQIINGILENPEFKNNDQKSKDFETTTFDSDHLNQDVNASIAALLRRSLPRVQMIGVGGAGNNSTARLMKKNVDDVEVLAINTDAQDLLNTKKKKKVLVGYSVTKGFGAGNDPNVGESAARESSEELKELITGDLVFITAGLGGGTGTGAAHVVAELAKEKGALTVSICTLPFNMEGPVRRSNALHGLKKLYHASDTVIVVPNQRLLTLSPEMSLMQGFKIADEVLVRAVSAISELITKPQMVNLDFADVRKVLGQGGVAMIGLGESRGQANKVEEAVNDAMNNPLLEDLDLSTARKALICVSGGEDLSLRDAEQVVSRIQARIDRDAEIIWGASISQDLHDTLRVITLISDIDSNFEKEGVFQLKNDAEDIANGLTGSSQYKSNTKKVSKNPLQSLRKKALKSLFKQ